MQSLISAQSIIWGSKYFGFGNGPVGNPAIFILGFPVYLYALIIVSGMGLAIWIAGRYFKKRGYDPYDITIYALILIPLAVLGARAYVYVFPWEGRASDWSTFFDFRSGGLGIYGGVIVGVVTVFVTALVKKQDYRIVADCMYPGVILAQSIGRWGNFANQEAYGALVSTDYNAFSNWFSFLGGAKGHGFNGLYVWIGNGTGAGGWYQATFFYESLATFIGFLIMVLVLTRSKHYRLGWCAAFYGIYYGTARLIIEGMRSDSLFLYIGTRQTDIKISQLVSVFAIVLGLWLLTRIYREQIHSLYRKLFASERSEVAISRWVLVGVSALFTAVSVVLYVACANKRGQNGTGGETLFILGTASIVLAVYSLLGIFSCNDRLKLYDNSTGERRYQIENCYSNVEVLRVGVVVISVAVAILIVCIGISLANISKIDVKIVNPNCIVLAIIFGLFACVGAWIVYNKIQKLKQLEDGSASSETDGETTATESTMPVKLSAVWLFFFPPKVYKDYTVTNLHEYVEPPKQSAKAEE